MLDSHLQGSEVSSPVYSKLNLVEVQEAVEYRVREPVTSWFVSNMTHVANVYGRTTISESLTPSPASPQSVISDGKNDRDTQSNRAPDEKANSD